MEEGSEGIWVQKEEVRKVFMGEVITINMSVSQFNFEFNKNRNYILITFLSLVTGLLDYLVNM